MPWPPSPHPIFAPPAPSSPAAASYLAACTVGLPTHATRAAVIADLDAAAHGRRDQRRRVHGRRRAHPRSLRAARRRRPGARRDRLAGLGVRRPHRRVPSRTAPKCCASRATSRRWCCRSRTRGAASVCASLRSTNSPTRSPPTPGSSRSRSCSRRRARWRMPRPSAPPRARHGARTLCDATQAVGWLPVDAADYDAVICHAYKWLCAPRGVAFLAISEEFAACVPPSSRAGTPGATRGRPATGTRSSWPRTRRGSMSRPRGRRSSAPSPRSSCSPRSTRAALHEHATGLAARVPRGPRTRRARARERDRHLERPRRPRPRRLTAAGIAASGRAGRARVAFHVFNDEQDVERRWRRCRR